MNIYLQLDSKNWYFFSYNRNVLYAISSDDEFNNPIKEAKSDKKKLKTEKGQAPYQFMLSPPKKKDDFKKRFEKFE
jgi:hypothetical protein